MIYLNEPRNTDDLGLSQSKYIHAKTLNVSIYKRKIYITSAQCSKGISKSERRRRIESTETTRSWGERKEVIRQFLRKKRQNDKRASGKVFPRIFIAFPNFIERKNILMTQNASILSQEFFFNGKLWQTSERKISIQLQKICAQFFFVKRKFSCL